MFRLVVRHAVKKCYSKISAPLLVREQSSSETVAELKTEEAMNNAAGSLQFEDPQPIKRSESERVAEFRRKLKNDMAAEELSKYNLMVAKENDPLPPWPENVNPNTGEVGGPRGPEPTRYGDWERKGICVDF